MKPNRFCSRPGSTFEQDGGGSPESEPPEIFARRPVVAVLHQVSMSYNFQALYSWVIITRKQ